MTCWARFRTDEGRVGFGALQDERLQEYEGDLFASPRRTGRILERGTFTLLSPCTPSKILALWNNFHALGAKLGKRAPAHPLFFVKPATTVIGPGEFIRRPASYAGKILYEGELGIVIGRPCKQVPVSEAARYIFGYTCVNDVTAAGVLDENPDFAQWCRAKGYDTFGCLGPVIATELDCARACVITCLDGVERQNYPLSDMIMAPPELVSLLSHDMTLLAGDVISCGTSLGVGSIKDGAAVEISIDGIGALANVLAARESRAA